MKPALMATIEVKLPAKADEIVPNVLSRIASKPLWNGQENKVFRGKSKDGTPTANIELRFDKLADRDDFVKYLKSLDDRPNVKVTGATHNCGHDEGKACDNWKDI